MESKPPCVDFAEHSATNLIPICLSVCDAGDSQIRSRSRNRPPRFSNPHRFTSDCTLSVVVCLEEDLIPRVDRVCLGILEIRVCVHANEIASTDNSIIRAVYPRSPRVNMTNESAACSGARDRRSDLADVANDVGWICAHAGEILYPDRGVSIEIFAADRYARNQFCEICAVLLDGAGEGCDFVGENSWTGGSPKAEEQTCFGVNGSCDGLCRRVCRTGLDHGVKTSAGEAGGTHEVLCGRKQILEIRLNNGGSVRVGGTVIEPLVNRGCRGANASCKGEKMQGEHTGITKGRPRNKRRQTWRWTKCSVGRNVSKPGPWN